MKILYTVAEGGQLKTFEFNPEPDKEIFAIYLPDGVIWDRMIGVDDVTRLTPKQFIELYQKLKEKENNER